MKWIGLYLIQTRPPALLTGSENKHVLCPAYFFEWLQTTVTSTVNHIPFKFNVIFWEPNSSKKNNNCFLVKICTSLPDCSVCLLSNRWTCNLSCWMVDNRQILRSSERTYALTEGLIQHNMYSLVIVIWDIHGRLPTNMESPQSELICKSNPHQNEELW